MRSQFVDQSEFSTPDGLVHGNCLSACLANLLDIRLSEIPNFCYYGENWFQPFIALLHKYDYDYEGSYYFNLTKHERTWEQLLQVSPGIDGVFIAGGRSPRPYVTNGHAVLYKDNKLLHDPHPSREGILTLDFVHMIERI